MTTRSVCDLARLQKLDRRTVSMEKGYHPEEHVVEEPRNDFMDLAVGFAGTFVAFLVVAAIFAAIEFALK
jgi:hypothetical protein